MHRQITITIKNKRALTVRGAYIVADNTDYTLNFVFDEPWEDYAQKVCRVIINGSYTDIDFTGESVSLPQIPSDAGYILIGCYAGNLSTTTPARIPVYQSILGLGDTEYDPTDPAVTPVATDVTLDDILRLNDVSAGKWVKATLRQILALAGAGVDPSDAAPLMDGDASPGTSAAFARGDHRHPTDTSRASQTDLIQLGRIVAGISDGLEAVESRLSADEDDLAVLAGETVKTVTQVLNDEQQAQARQNINAADADTVTNLAAAAESAEGRLNSHDEDLSTMSDDIADLQDDVSDLQTGKVSTAQGPANAGKFLVVGSDGGITLVTLAEWQGGNY